MTAEQRPEAPVALPVAVYPREWRHQRRKGLTEHQLEALRGHVNILVGLGFSLSEIASVANCSRPTISRLLAGGSVSATVGEGLWQTEPDGGCPKGCPCRASDGRTG